jgi:hypothetical protein
MMLAFFAKPFILNYGLNNHVGRLILIKSLWISLRTFIAI